MDGALPSPLSMARRIIVRGAVTVRCQPRLGSSGHSRGSPSPGSTHSTASLGGSECNLRLRHQESSGKLGTHVLYVDELQALCWLSAVKRSELLPEGDLEAAGCTYSPFETSSFSEGRSQKLMAGRASRTRRAMSGQSILSPLKPGPQLPSTFSKTASMLSGRHDGLTTDDQACAQYVAHNARVLTRIYPKGLRISSDNLDPLPHWRCGAQMVALNAQTNDLPLQLNRALFSLDGGCGYVLKRGHRLGRGRPPVRAASPSSASAPLAP